eukprot:Nk52_evm42s239 gene=Nk52_evmTU42s239
MAVVNQAMEPVQESYSPPISDLEWSVIVSVMMIGGVTGALAATNLADRYGRRKALEIADVGYIIGAFLSFSSAATDITSFAIALMVLGRVFSGFAIGITLPIVPLFQAEIAPVNLRGTASSVQQLGVVSGILIALVFGAPWCLGTEDGWRWAFVLPVFVSGLHLLLSKLFSGGKFAKVLGLQKLNGTIVMESPAWLLMQNRTEEAKNILKGLRQSDKVASSDCIDAEIETDLENLRPSSHGTEVTVKSLFSTWSIRRPLFIGLTLMFAQQLTGINAVIFYSTDIFEDADTGLSASTTSVLVGVVNFLATVVALPLVEKLGRRSLLLFSCSTSALFLYILTIALNIADGVGDDTTTASVMNGFAVASILCFVGCFAVGMGPIPFVLLAEIFPVAFVATAASLALAVNLGLMFILSIAFLPLANSIGGARWVFLPFAILSTFFSCIIFKWVPETKGATLQEIHRRVSSFHLQKDIEVVSEEQGPKALSGSESNEDELVCIG